MSALAGLVTAAAAVAAIAFGSNSASKSDDPTKGSTHTVVVGGAGPSNAKRLKDEYTVEDWAHDADEICGIVYDDIRALGILDDPNATWQLLPRLLQISAQGNERIGALERPKEAADKIAEDLKQAGIAENAAQNAYDAYNLGDTDSAAQYWQAYLDASARSQQLDTELGANVCARGP
ncbi:MAG TPA: hypothetical protein VFX51_00020 [Solirubrobacteraceae bacterium]|nr:hypothetical protein [Solirubrobacteraceae bacterium]